VLLSAVDVEIKAKTPLVLWRAWHLRNDAIHADGSASVIGSAMFLSSYRESLQLGSLQSGATSNGKQKVGHWVNSKSSRKLPGPSTGKKQDAWRKPPQGWAKINTDAGFYPDTGTASVGVIARGHKDEVLQTAWKSIRECRSVEEAEAEACLDGIKLAIEWIRQPIRMETDCTTPVHALRAPLGARAQQGREQQPRGEIPAELCTGVPLP
jgi:hypothetical protein